MSKEFKLTRKVEGNANAEITANLTEFKNTLGKIYKNDEIMLLVKDPVTRLLKRYDIFSSKKKAMSKEKELNKEGIQTIQVIKEKTGNQYNGVFLFMDEKGNVQYEIGLDGTLRELNKSYKDKMHLRKQRTHKEEVGYIAFALNSKSNKVVCTRLYEDEEQALMFIQRRKNISHNTIRVFKVVRYYNGFKFKHQDLDDCRRIKDAKAKLGR